MLLCGKPFCSFGVFRADFFVVYYQGKTVFQLIAGAAATLIKQQ